MCIDANAAARHQARQEYLRKEAEYGSQSLKYWNRETSAKRGMELAARGFSSQLSNDYQRALYTAGQARAQYEAGYAKWLKSKGSVDEGGRARRRTTGALELLRAKGALQNAVQHEFGANLQRRYRSRLTQMQGIQAKTRESLGIRPEYGAPVLMPPSDRLSGALSIASQVIGLAGTATNAFPGLFGMFNNSRSTMTAPSKAGINPLTNPYTNNFDLGTSTSDLFNFNVNPENPFAISEELTDPLSMEYYNIPY